MASNLLCAQTYLPQFISDCPPVSAKYVQRIAKITILLLCRCIKIKSNSSHKIMQSPGLVTFWCLKNAKPCGFTSHPSDGLSVSRECVCILWTDPSCARAGAWRKGWLWEVPFSSWPSGGREHFFGLVARHKQPDFGSKLRS